MTTNLLLTGGPHPFASTTPLLVDLLADHGIATTVVTDPFEALARLGAAEAGTGPRVDLVTVHALRWRMDQERYADERAEHAVAVDDVDLAVLDRFVRSGGGLLALHTAVICFDAAATWRALCGASWDWERSSHPPLGPVTVTPTEAGRAHEVTGGVGGFIVEDEAYGFLDEVEGLAPLLVADHGGRTHPLVWARTVGEGRVVTDLLGHGPPAFEHPVHRRVLARAATWAASPAATVPGPAAGDAPARSHP
ncbi:MAG: ThuA domain-containing protein [Acidimicrobiales bacterium]|nr:ThuA domain-containing protein [Acidimicrobiales bacterium]